MALFTFTVKPDGQDEYQVDATSRDILNWEKTTKGASLGKFESDPQITDVYKIAHFAARRTGLFTGTLQEFESGVDIEFEKDEDEASDPTRSAR